MEYISKQVVYEFLKVKYKLNNFMGVYMKKLALSLIVILLFLSGCSAKASLNSDVNFNIKKDSHIEFYYESNDKPGLEDVEDMLIRDYDKVISDLNPNSIPTIKVKIYSDYERFYNSLKKANANDSTIAYPVSDSEIHIISPSIANQKYNYMYMEGIALYVFSKNILNQICDMKDISTSWVAQSIMLYEGRSYSKPSYNNLPSVLDIRDTNNPILNQYGYMFTSYVIDKWGKDGLQKLLKNKGDIKSALGISIEDFDNGWHKYINKEF